VAAGVIEDHVVLREVTGERQSAESIVVDAVSDHDRRALSPGAGVVCLDPTRFDVSGLPALGYRFGVLHTIDSDDSRKNLPDCVPQRR